MSDKRTSTPWLRNVLLAAVAAIFCGAHPSENRLGGKTNADSTSVNAAAATGRVNSQGSNDKAHAWDSYVERFLRDYFEAHPDFAVQAGKHEFDGQMPDWSEGGLKREIARLHAEHGKASALIDEPLDEHQRFEHDYLLAD